MVRLPLVRSAHARPLLALCCLLLSLLAPDSPARAGTLSVMPIRIELAAGQKLCALTIGNDSDGPVSVQVRGFGWTRSETGEDLLDPQTGPVINPAIATIPPRGSRLIRCSLPAATSQGPAPAGPWRLVIDELPSNQERPAGSIQTLLRLSIPIFREAQGSRPRLVWRPARLADGTPAIRLDNAGRRHAQIADVRLRGSGDTPSLFARGFYLLPGGSRLLPVDARRIADGSVLVANSDSGMLEIVRADANEDSANGDRPALPATAMAGPTG